MPKDKDSWFPFFRKSPKKKLSMEKDKHLQALTTGASPNSSKFWNLLPSKNSLFFSTRSAKSSALPASSAVSGYATIRRKKPAQLYQQLCDYYCDLCSDDNTSVCSLPLPPRETSYSRGNAARFGGSISGMTQFRSYSSSTSNLKMYPTSSFSSGSMGDNPFAFLDEYEIEPEQLDDPEQFYFLPRKIKDEACQKWIALESSGDYCHFTPDDEDSLKRKPLCLKRWNVVKSKMASSKNEDMMPYYF